MSGMKTQQLACAKGPEAFLAGHPVYSVRPKRIKLRSHIAQVSQVANPANDIETFSTA